MNSDPTIPIRILLADDHKLFRAGIASLLEKEPDFAVVGQAENGEAAITLAKKMHPDVALLDVQMPVCTGLEAACHLLALKPDIKIIMLTISDRDADLFTAVKSGAQGYLLKSSVSANELTDAVRRVAAGEAIITPSLVPHLLTEFATLSQQPTKPPQEPAPTLNRLTNRERETLELVAQGLTNREIANQLVISENTVRTHLRNILDKLHVQNRLQAAAVLHQQDS
jgi:two-component system NarL family response regulator